MAAANRNERAIRLAGGAAIILLTTLAYIPAISGKFVWDDNSWTTDIRDLLTDSSGLRTMWLHPTSLQQYYPLAATSFWIDYHLWGFKPPAYHVENILLHTISAILFWQLLRRLDVPGAWLAGAIFAVHPVMVESVAWITERKNTLSMVLFLSALLAYGRFARFWQKENDSAADRESPREIHWIAYAFAFILFLGAMLAKSTAFSFPAVILLICWWKRGRIRFADIWPTLPFFLFSIGYSLATSWLEKNHVGAKGPEWDLSFAQRCLIAGHVFWFYIGKLLWPANLYFIYPRWQLNAGSWRQWLYPIGAAGVLLILWLARNRIGRGPITAALFFVGTLFPVLGFMNAYFMRFSFVCDHWTYLSSLGLFALAAALAVRAAEYYRARPALYGFVAGLLPLLAFLTWRQSGTYADVDTLWRDTLAKNPGAWVAHYNLGYQLQIAGNLAGAKEQYEQALQYNPDCDEAANNLAWMLATASPADGGDPNRAVTLAEHACELSQNENASYLATLAVAYSIVGRFHDAVNATQTAIALTQSSGPAAFVDAMETRLHLYQEGRPFQPGVVQDPKNP
jgi:protein O-mannosyl-transferase